METGTLLVAIVIPGVLLASFCLFKAFRDLRCKRAVDDTPTSRTKGVFLGLAEVKGTAESESPLVSHLANLQCVQYSWKVEEEWSRIVMTKHGPRRESGWDVVDSGGQSQPFYLKDETGVLRILPEGASIENVSTFDETCSKDDALYYLKGPSEEISNSTHHRHFTETAVPLHAMLYIMGQARERKDVVAAEIAESRNATMFLISTRTEKQVSAGLGYRFLLWLLGGLICSFLTVFFWHILEENGGSSGRLHYIIAGCSFLAASGLVWVWMVYNSFVNLHHRVEQGWSQVDVQLKRRNDLIPNLVQVVEGYRNHEKETQTVLAEMRNQMEATPPGVKGPDFRGMSLTLKAIMESYPELKASESFLSLQKALADTEQRIALARDYFNGVATAYNTRLEIIPDRWIGALARLHPRTLMVAADFERAPVEVKLA